MTNEDIRELQKGENTHNADLEREFLKRRGIHIPMMYGALELASMDIPPTKWIVKGILPVGVTHFAGKEKMFKSFAALGLCAAVSNGMEYFGFPTDKSETLYFDMESSESRPHDRLNLISRTLPLSDDCHIITRNNLTTDKGIPLTLDNGFAETLTAILDYNTNIKLVVVDVFSKIRSKRKNGEDTYSWDYRDVTVLKDIADKHDVSVVIVNHVVKGEVYSDDYDSARGSGINPAADCIWMLTKDKNSERSGVLKIKGRDVESQEYAIQFDTDNFIWKRYSTTEEVVADRLRKEYERTNIRQTLQAVTQWSVTWDGKPSDLIKISYKTNTPIPSNANQLGMDLKKYEALLREDGFSFVKYGKDYHFTNHNHANE